MNIPEGFISVTFIDGTGETIICGPGEIPRRVKTTGDGEDRQFFVWYGDNWDKQKWREVDEATAEKILHPREAGSLTPV